MSFTKKVIVAFALTVLTSLVLGLLGFSPEDGIGYVIGIVAYLFWYYMFDGIFPEKGEKK